MFKKYELDFNFKLESHFIKVVFFINFSSPFLLLYLFLIIFLLVTLSLPIVILVPEFYRFFQLMNPYFIVIPLTNNFGNCLISFI